MFVHSRKKASPSSLLIPLIFISLFPDCEDGYQRYYGECVKPDSQECPDGQFPIIDDSDQTQCVSCHETCATCQGPLEEECLSCRPRYKLGRGTCELNCADNMYHHVDDSGTDICLGKRLL